MKGCVVEGTKIDQRGFGYAMKILSGKYKMIILYWLDEYGVMRYGKLKRTLSNITHKMLSATLKEMENDDLIVRKEYPQVPPKVEYSLSKHGKSLMPVLDELCERGEKSQIIKNCGVCSAAFFAEIRFYRAQIRAFINSSTSSLPEKMPRTPRLEHFIAAAAEAKVQHSATPAPSIQRAIKAP